MIGAFEPVLALTIVYMGALRGAGDTVFPLFFTAFGLALVRLPVSYLLALYLGWGLRGAWLGVSADLLVRMTLAWTRFRRGRWVATKV
jgi:Na+-driven multidrug efflux pump